jgi:trehalose 6-phosphate synthase/phosphatase
MKFYGLGLGLDSFRMVALDMNFRRLDVVSVNEAFSRSQSRVFLLDYDQTLMATTSFSAQPSKEVLDALSALCSDTSNTVAIVSGRRSQDLESWFGGVENLGLIAEHGYKFWPPGGCKWETHLQVEPTWHDVVLPVLEHYVECTDGSYVEKKESALVWHYQDTDPDYGSWQAKELLDHLDSVLANQPVEAARGAGIVEVQPQGASKGASTEIVLSWAKKVKDDVDFVFCVGDDRSDEQMFAAVEHVTYSPHMPAEVFACTVGAKPSRAPFYVDDPGDVIDILRNLSTFKL